MPDKFSFAEVRQWVSSNVLGEMFSTSHIPIKNNITVTLHILFFNL